MSDESRPHPTVALVLPTLVPVFPLPRTPREERIVEVARSLQMTAATPDLTAIYTAVHVGHWAVDRMTEIMGRLGSAGEQLGLALTTNKDARRWIDSEAETLDGWSSRSVTLAVRAQSETTALWTLGAAHGLANALVRMLWLNETSRVVIDQQFDRAEGFPPFSENPRAWVSFEPHALRSARRAAATVESPAIDLIVQALSEVVRDSRWAKFLELRNVGFHRWRPQSVDGGTPKSSSYEMMPGGGRSISVGVGATNQAPDPEEVLAIAETGLDLFTEAADVFDMNFHAAINELGLVMFEV